MQKLYWNGPRRPSFGLCLNRKLLDYFRVDSNLDFHAGFALLIKLKSSILLFLLDDFDRFESKWQFLNHIKRIYFGGIFMHIFT